MIQFGAGFSVAELVSEHMSRSEGGGEKLAVGRLFHDQIKLLSSQTNSLANWLGVAVVKILLPVMGMADYTSL